MSSLAFLILLSTSLNLITISIANLEASILSSWISTSPALLDSFSSWVPTDSNPCNWTYITCNPNGFVSEISLPPISLQVSLPENISDFKSLTKLSLPDCNLTGTIPQEIGKLAELTELDLSSNQLAGKIPPDIGNCKNLKSVLLFDNWLGGEIPMEIGKLGLLEVLRIGGNSDITGEIPSEIGDCRNLTVVGLADTRVSGAIPSSFGKLSRLTTLSVYTAMLSGEIPPELGNCSELVNLYLYENALSGRIPGELGKLKNLEKLLLWQNNIDGSIPEELGNCTSLTMIDVSLNSLSGSIPWSFESLVNLEELLLSNNNISGSIPSVLSKATHLAQLQLDTNQMSGLIPSELGSLSNLLIFFAWENQLEGSIPSSLSDCGSLQALDLSRNSLTGTIPRGLFQLKNLTKLLLISNGISGTIPAEIGDCTNLIRLRLGNNRISGQIPKEIGELKILNFLDLSSNRLSGPIPDQIRSCTQLQMVDLSNNMLEGSLPNSISSLSSLQVLDFSRNKLVGPVPASFGRLSSLNKLILSYNSFTGSIPLSLGLCLSLQLLDLSSNELIGNIPIELCQIKALEIALNLSSNILTGPIPTQISALKQLSTLDLSYNKLSGDLKPLSEMDNLVSLNISYNNFTGYLPDKKLFRQLPAANLAGNQIKCSFGQESCFLSNNKEKPTNQGRRSRGLKVALGLLISMTITMVIMGIIAMIRARRTIRGDDDSELGESWPWTFTPFQKLNFSVEQILKSLVDTNVIGKGCSGVVYRAEIEEGEVIAVKKLWPSTIGTTDYGHNGEKCGVRDSFSAEVRTLGSIRHKNIVRFLGCCWNRNTRLLMYDYMPNGSLGSLLHERKGSTLDWELRYQILLGAAQGLAYLHHDCVPPIVHRDIKANNILIGLEFEPYIADFGLAKLVNDGDFNRSSNTVAGSYGYIAPEYGYMMKITEKSDLYSYGVVVLEVLTGKQPIDPMIPDGRHLVDWVRQKKGSIEVIDPTLLSRPDSETEEILQALGVALLCVNPVPDDRPTMKDVAAMLREIRLEREEYAKVDMLLKGYPDTRHDGENRKACQVPATSSSAPGMQTSLPKSNNGSFSASLYSTSSNAKGCLK